MEPKTYTGLFRVGEFNISVPADQLREVVLHPERLSPLPDAADCMDGTFSLRGQCVPVINLNHVLGVPREAAPFVAITQCDGKTLGLAVRNIVKVSAVSPHAPFEMAGEKEERSRLFTRCFHDSEDESLVHVLNLSALHSCDGVRTAVQLQKTIEGDKETADEPPLHLALFSVGGRSFGVERSAVWKALPAQQITERVSDMGLLRGYLMDHDPAIPVLDLLGLFRMPAATESARLSQGIVLQHSERKVGFEIDQVIGSTKTTVQSLAPLGGTSNQGATPLTRSGCRMLNSKGYGLVIVLDLPVLLQQEELRNATANQRRVNVGQIRRPEGESISKPAVSFVTYYVGASRFCTPLAEVEAIVPLSEFLSLSNGDSYFRGVMEWRNQVVNLFDLNVLLGVEDVGAASEIKVSHRRCLIVRGGGPFGPEYRGYLVDEVQALASAVPEPIPSLITKSWASRGGPACPRITEMIQISAPDGSRSNVNVLHLAECEAPSTPPLALIA